MIERKHRCHLLVGISAALVLLTAGCSREPSPPSFILITIDALRADHLGIYGYHRPTSPNIDRFFAHGTVYEYAYSTEASTTPSVVSMLTGKLPQETGVRLLYQKVPADLMMLPDYLSEVGYQTVGIVSNIVLTTEASDLDRHFDYYDDYVDEREPYRDAYERNARATTDAVIEWYKRAYDRRKPFFLWVHYIDTHGPYHPPSDKPVDFTHEGEVIIDVKKMREYQREPGVYDGLEYVDLYDEEIAYMDQHVGRLLDFLAEQNLIEDSVVIFSADHGESMMEHKRYFAHSYHVWEEIIHVPLLFRHPGQRKGERVKTRVSLVDLVPTLLAEAGIEVKEELRGRILNGGSLTPAPIYSEGREWRSMASGDLKWLVKVNRDRARPQRVGIYDLEKDPGELRRLPWAKGKEAHEFYQLIASDEDPGGIPREYAKGMQLNAPKVRPGLDEATVEKLRSLGYVE